MTTIALSYSRIYNKAPQANWKIICFTGFILCSFLLVFYIYQIINLTKGSYSINSYEKQLALVSEENKDLEFSFAESNFLGQVLAKTQKLNFQKTISVSYVQILDSSVASVQKDNMK
ncbi:MAG: hypothetical protein US31_C0003G0042 [Berkelbacteria bacterium GW2011_GWA1_36_9]|uniref:Uncharacterized protein n=1 Tax=Berkelbacteria bacterium GW2011_GWA1_36_9 TaxID=1618331 RepID=A0A0G0FHX9_9BACT|nr:MAG: hypothetical protein US31_C0003G0042 [Berkelbacteria bacterium GW2011_GWA1_36_9]